MQGKRSGFRRPGLHKLECGECGNVVYSTVACLERHGLPACGCGGAFLPDELELAMLLGVDSPAVAEYERELSSILHGQAAHVQRGRVVQQPEDLAARRVDAARRVRCREAQLAALRPTVEALPF